MKHLIISIITLCVIAIKIDAGTPSQKPKNKASISNSTIDRSINKGKPFFFIQMADPQLGFNKELDMSRDIPYLERAIKIINRLKPDFITVAGDMVNEQLNDKSAEIFLQYMSKIDKKIKVHYIAGNHDINKLLPKYFEYYERHFGKDRFSFRHKNCAFIGVNSTIIQEGESELEAEQYAWLEKELKKAKKCRMRMVFSHIPLVYKSMDEEKDYSNYPMNMRKKYMALFKKYDVSALMCGHLHKNAYVASDGIEIITTNALGFPFAGEHGMTLVKVGKNSYEHQFLSLDEFDKIESVK